MGLAVVFLLVGLLIGFFVGTRGRQILATAKILHKAVRSFTVRLPDAAAVAAASQDDGGDDRIEDEADPQTIDIQDWLSSDHVPGLEDHPDLEVNPVIMYQVRKAKDQAREERRLKQLSDTRERLLEEGVSESEINSRLMELEGAGNAGQQMRNSLALLISIGARVEAGAGAGNADAVALQDRRRRARNVDMYLQNSLEVDVKKTAPKKASSSGVRMKSAFDVAKESGSSSYDRSKMRNDAQPHVAKYARNLYREWKVKNKALLDTFDNGDSDEENAEKEGKKEKDEGHRRGGGMLDASDLAALQAEFADELMGEEEEDEPMEA